MNNRILTAALGATALLSACASESSNPIESPITLAKEVTTTSVHFDTVTGGGYHSCGITDVQVQIFAGIVRCWGLGSNYMLGSGSTANSATPVQVIESNGFAFAGWTQVSAGRDHSCGLKSGILVHTFGPAHCWGLNTSGQLGNGTTTGSQYNTPTIGGVSFKTVTAGGKHTCGIATTGTAYCWGDGTSGQLGNGLSGVAASRTSPTPVSSNLTWKWIEAGDFHTCAIDQGNGAFCWGRNNAGQLGIGSTISKTVPTRAITSLGLWEISAGGSHTCARTDGSTLGKVYCWGDGFYGQLGNNTSGTGARALVPTLIQQPAGVIYQSISAGLNHTCGVTTSGSTYCWGRNTYAPGSGGSGQLGDGTATNRNLPTIVSGAQSYTQVSAGYYHNTATTGLTYSWGLGEFGQLGNGTISSGYFSLVPVEVQ